MQQPEQSAANRGYSLIQDCGYYSSPCGYCKDAEESSVSTGKSAHGMHAHRLTVYDYQELLDQGWRRSGKFLYKPDNQNTCCRQYTIRLDVTDFQPTKAHKKLLRKWDQFLAGTHHHEPHTAQQGAATSTRRSSSPGDGQAGCAEQPGRHTASPKRPRRDASSTSQSQEQQQQQQQQQHSSSSTESQLLDQVRSLLHAAVSELQQAYSSGCDLNTQLLPAVRLLPAQQHQQQHKHKPNWLLGTVCSSPCPHALAAAVRKHTNQQERQQQQSAAGSVQAADAPSSSSSGSLWLQPEQLAQSLADTFNRLAACAQPAVGVAATASKGHVNFTQQRQQQQEGSSATQQDTAIQQATTTTQQQQQQGSGNASASSKHGQQPQQQQQQQQQRPSLQPQQQQQPHKLEVAMVPSQFIQEEFLLWQRYQAQQHHDPLDDLTPKHYKGFLVDTPLIHVPPTQTAAAAAGGAQASGQQQQQHQAAGMPSCGYGSFHQQYWLDGKLVAVGVVDVLPRCLSSKYFFWDPDHAWLSLGRYGALREISWVASQHAAGAAAFRYYYLGFYIHSCPKMAYKAEYPPSELLCPQRQVWVRFGDTVREAFDHCPYVVLSDLPGVQIRPNLSVPRQLPAAAAAAAGMLAGAAAASSNGAGGLQGRAQSLSTEQQQQQVERPALDGQLLLVMKQPVRWGVLRESGLLDEGDVGVMEEQLTAWRRVVGETSRTLLYATAQDMLSV